MSKIEKTEAVAGRTYSAPALSKGLDILELLAAQTNGMRKFEIASALGRSLSEIFRMLAVLVDRQYVEFDPQSERYSLSLKMFSLSHRHPPTKRLTALAGGMMETIAQRHNQSCHLAILHGSDILVIAQIDPPGNNITAVRLGAQVPAALTASGAVLVHLWPEDELDSLVARTPDVSPALAKIFHDNIELVRNAGFCQCPSPIVEGVQNISVPIFNYGGDVAAALTVPFVHRLLSQHQSSVAETRRGLLAASEELSSRLGAETTKTAAPDPSDDDG